MAIQRECEDDSEMIIEIEQTPNLQLVDQDDFTCKCRKLAMHLHSAALSS